MWNIEWTLSFTMEIITLEDPIILWTFHMDDNSYFQCQMTATQLIIEVKFETFFQTFFVHALFFFCFFAIILHFHKPV